ncbi:MAG: pyruvate ferredoxin oxidoreductase, partial [Archaeoglobaceae archaeon]
MTSNEAIAEAVKIAEPDIIAAYPITPQSPIVERLAEMVERGELKSKFICVESEHSAMAVIHGAA